MRVTEKLLRNFSGKIIGSTSKIKKRLTLIKKSMYGK
jgi:hypothetical protein